MLPLPRWRTKPVLGGAIAAWILCYLYVRLCCVWGFADMEAYRAELRREGSDFAETVQEATRPWWLVGDPKAFGRAGGRRNIVILSATNPADYVLVVLTWPALWVESLFGNVFVMMG